MNTSAQMEIPIHAESRSQGARDAGRGEVAMTGKRAANAILDAHSACQGGIRDVR